MGAGVPEIAKVLSSRSSIIERLRKEILLDVEMVKQSRTELETESSKYGHTSLPNNPRVSVDYRLIECYL